MIDAPTGYVASFMNLGDNLSGAGILLRAGESLPANTNTLMTFQDGDGDEVGSITFDPTQTFYNTTSDARLKKDVENTQLTLDTLMNIKVYDYNWKDRPTASKVHGFLAQELFEVYPQAVSRPTSEEKFWSIDYSKLMPLAIKSIQDQQNDINALNSKVDGLKTLSESGEISQVAKWNYQAWTYLTEVIFDAKAKFMASVEFMGDVAFNAPVRFFKNVTFNRVAFADKDMGGAAVIPVGEKTVRVNFASAFAKAPVVTVTPQGEAVAVAVENVTDSGFTVKLKEPLSQPLSVLWIAMPVQYDGEIMTQSGEGQVAGTTAPAATPQPSPTASPEPSNTPEASVAPSPTPSLEPTPMPSPIVEEATSSATAE